VLGACLQSALRHGYAARNPVRDLPAAERPRPERKEAAYFENAELPRIFAELPEGLVKTLFLLALKTGIRQGDLLALRWEDLTRSARHPAPQPEAGEVADRVEFDRAPWKSAPVKRWPEPPPATGWYAKQRRREKSRPR
jgi:integrase